MRIACIGDLHLRGEGVFLDEDRKEYFKELFSYIKKKHKIKHIIVCGDTVRTMGDPKNKKHFTYLITILKNIGCYSYKKCTYVPGNHDYQKYSYLHYVPKIGNHTQRNPTLLRKIMTKVNYLRKKPSSFRDPFIKTIGEIAIIGVNTVSGKHDSSNKGYLNYNSYLHIKNFFRNSEGKYRHIIVASHHPLYETKVYGDKLGFMFSCGFDEEFTLSFNTKKVTLLNGHEHNISMKKSGATSCCVGGTFDYKKILIIDIKGSKISRRFYKLNM